MPDITSSQVSQDQRCFLARLYPNAKVGLPDKSYKAKPVEWKPIVPQLALGQSKQTDLEGRKR
jgi:hypothetical protein